MAQKGRPKNRATESLAAKLAVSKRTAQRLAQEFKGGNLDEFAKTKLRKLLAEAAKLEEQLAILRRTHVPAALMREQGTKAGAILSAELAALSTELPPLLSGLSEVKMGAVIRDATDRTLHSFCDAIESI